MPSILPAMPRNRRISSSFCSGVLSGFILNKTMCSTMVDLLPVASASSLLDRPHHGPTVIRPGKIADRHPVGAAIHVPVIHHFPAIAVQKDVLSPRSPYVHGSSVHGGGSPPACGRVTPTWGPPVRRACGRRKW